MRRILTQLLRRSRRPRVLDGRRLASSSSSSSSLSSSSSMSLIPETLASMEEEAKAAAAAAAAAAAKGKVPISTTTAADLRLLGKKRLSLEERKQRRRALDGLGIAPFVQFLKQQGLTLQRAPLEILQLNIGLYCNQACNHCHVESSPKRIKEMMSREIADRCLEFLRRSPSIKTLDLTGGAPELNSQFRYLVEEASPLGVEIIDRCNLTVLEEPGQEDLGAFLSKHRVKVVASLPCYDEKNVKLQRGSSVYQRSIAGLKKLNACGYGQEGTGLHLTLVYNPVGAFLPPAQGPLESKYKEELATRFGIVFNDLICITNMPIKRFADALHRAGRLQEYMQLLVQSFNPQAVEGLMCRTHLSVGWDGRLYDCDFNQQLDMAMKGKKNGQSSEGGGGSEGSCTDSRPLTIFDVTDARDLEERSILLDNHCFGMPIRTNAQNSCTAGEGSSCGGSTT